MTLVTKISVVGERKLVGHYDDVCLRKDCDIRLSPSIAALGRIAALRAISIAILLCVAAFFGSTVTLIVHAQVSVPDRLALVERDAAIRQFESSMVGTQIAALQNSVASDRDRISELQSQISTMKGIGIGLASLVMILQIFNLMIKRNQ